MRLLKLGSALAGVVLGMVTAAGAQSHRWESLQEVKPGTRLIVGTDSRYGGISYDRCRMVDVDTLNLNCVEEGKQGARLVFPASQVEYVSRVTKPFNLGAWLVGAVVGVFLGGVLSGNPTAIGAGAFGLLLAAIASGVVAEQRGLDAVLGRTSAPEERIHLIYSRVWVPALSGIPVPAATAPLPPGLPDGL